jgi:uncharacterized membrane protein HdeD (DUF308 family)
MNRQADPPRSAKPEERWLVAAVALVALGAALVSAYIAALYLPSLGSGAGSTFFALLFSCSSALAGYVAFRLIGNAPRGDGGLLPPSGILLGSVLLAVCIVLPALLSRDAPLWLRALSLFTAGSLLAGGWRLAKWRRRRHAT